MAKIDALSNVVASIFNTPLNRNEMDLLHLNGAFYGAAT